MLVATMMTQVPDTAFACGTLGAVEQREVDRDSHRSVSEAAIRKLKASDLIFMGKVISLKRPDFESDTPGQVTLEITETLKGSPPGAVMQMPWRSAFVLSCNPVDTFDNVGFADALSYVVYVSDGRITRTRATSETGSARTLSLDEERRIVLSGSGKDAD